MGSEPLVLIRLASDIALGLSSGITILYIIFRTFDLLGSCGVDNSNSWSVGKNPETAKPSAIALLVTATP